jgi:uncharacterized protein YrrD
MLHLAVMVTHLQLLHHKVIMVQRVVQVVEDMVLLVVEEQEQLVERHQALQLPVQVVQV